jgi:hypothetical protein
VDKGKKIKEGSRWNFEGLHDMLVTFACMLGIFHVERNRDKSKEGYLKKRRK